MADAVARAIKKAHTGDIVLLSPGCSSFDMFEDFIERGNQFKKIVGSL
jgi:UDP-N-acetylmuramoylalanine--D-glutamate ligase